MHGYAIYSMWRWSVLAGLLWLVLTVGCGRGRGEGVNPDVAEDVERQSSEQYLASKYPDTEYVTAWGYSTGNLREAELDAKARISEQIVSSIRAETKSIAQAWMTDSVIKDRQLIESSVHAETSFNRAELIRIDKSTVGCSTEGVYQVYAYMRRADLGAELAVSYDDYAIAFRADVAQARESINDLFAFTAPWCSARQNFSQLYPQACKHQAILGDFPPALAKDLLLLRELQEMRSEIMAGLSIGVTLESSLEVDTNPLVAALNSALLRLGLATESGACTGTTTLSLVLRPELTWDQLMGSKFCKLRLLGEVIDCAGEQTRKHIIVSGAVLEGRGANPRSSLARRVTAESLVPLLGESLGGILPLHADCGK